MSAPYDYASGSDSDSDDAPEVVSLSTAKSARQEQERKALEAKQLANKSRKEKARAKGKQAKQVKGKGKARQEDEDEDDEDADDLDEGALEAGDDLEEEDEGDEEDDVAGPPSPPPQVGKKTTYLDDSVFAEAAAHYAPQQTGPALGELSKKAQRKLVKAEKQRKREAQELRDAEVREGGQTQAGDITLQHLAGIGQGPASLSSTALPSHTSATKFLTQRLYSKKRQVAVLEAGRQGSGDAKKPKMKGGMSMESRILLGLEEEEDEDAKKQKERKKKRSLLLQADGQRKSAPSARPLASARRGARPAANFAVSSYRG
ncbi:hypothetical protein JCM8097_000191 [Rhodosporidiobolus ruineniae]